MTSHIIERLLDRAMALPHPRPRVPIAIRAAVPGDLKFIDALQKKHGKAVAFATTKELLSYISDGTALIAEAPGSNEPRPSGSGAGDEEPVPRRRPVGVEDRAQNPLPHGRGSFHPIGYILYHDRYMKREDCGNIVQLAVEASKHRGLVGAALVKAMFERVPWGVRLFCCWCAQDLEANSFWEALGFVPLACRAGSRGREHGGRRNQTRVQIFWQRRVREGDDAYPYWYPSQTSGGRMGESRLVLPIPPGTHWSDEMPIVLPGMDANEPRPSGSGAGDDGSIGVEDRAQNPLPHPRNCRDSSGTRARKSKSKVTAPAAQPLSVTNGLRFGPCAAEEGHGQDAHATKLKRPRTRPRMPKQPRSKNDPKFIAAAREIRDRYLEEVNSGGGSWMLPAAAGKYDVSRQLQASGTGDVPGAGAPVLIQTGQTPAALLSQAPPARLLDAA